MRIALHLFGAEILDLYIGPHHEPDPEPADLDERGSCTTYPIGFTGPPEVPADMEVL